MDYLNDHYYAFTVRILRKPKLATSHDYDTFFEHINYWTTLWEKQIEMADDIIHFHGIISLSPKLYRKKLMLHNFHLKLTRIYNRTGWENYIRKDIFKLPFNLFKRIYKNAIYL